MDVKPPGGKPQASPPRPGLKLGNEFSTKRPALLDLRPSAIQPIAAHPNAVKAPRPPITAQQVGHALKRTTTAPVHVTFNPVKVTKVPKQTFLDGFAYDLLFIVVAMFVSLASPLRDWLFLLYLIAAIVFKIGSQRIFRSALFCLVLIPVLTVLKRADTADTFAVFTFYFLAIGVVRAIIELRD